MMFFYKHYLKMATPKLCRGSLSNLNAFVNSDKFSKREIMYFPVKIFAVF